MTHANSRAGLQLPFFILALQLPEAQGDQQGQEQQGEQGDAPLEIEFQSARHRAPVPRKWECAGLYCPLKAGDCSLLKIIIVILMLALVASLGSGFYYLMVDQGDKSKRRTFHSLGVRLTLAIGLIVVITYGVATGQLGHRTPWDPGPMAAPGPGAQPKPE